MNFFYRIFGGNPYAIHDATKKGDLEKLKALLKGNSDLVFSKEKEQGRTPLHFAALEGNLSAAEFLLASKADVNAKDDWGWTPLHCAALRYSTAMINLLIANNADVNAQSRGGGTPLHVCNNANIAKILLDNNVDINASDNEGWTPLDFAVYEGLGHETMINFLRQNGGYEHILKRGNPFSKM